MIDISYPDPGSPVPDPTSDRARHFHSSAREEFFNEIEDLAQRRGRRVFVATEQSRPVAIGLTNSHQILSLQNGEALLSESNVRHQVSPDIQSSLEVGEWYQMAVDPASGKILAARRENVEAAPAKAMSTFPINLDDLFSVSQFDVNKFFSNMRRQPHIPFQYPLNGCWVRAHEMARLIEGYFDPHPEDVVAKIWNIGTLTVKTDNSPECLVRWGYHVAPIVKVGSNLLVLDPSLFEAPVAVDEWIRCQSDAPSDCIFTSRYAYNLVINTDFFVGEGPGQTEAQLRDFSGDLLSSIFSYGPLPYPCKL
jgi:hypothetical protein